MNQKTASTGAARRIVIVGGGYVGWEVARDLDAHAEVTLI